MTILPKEAPELGITIPVQYTTVKKQKEVKSQLTQTQPLEDPTVLLRQQLVKASDELEASISKVTRLTQQNTDLFDQLMRSNSLARDLELELKYAKIDWEKQKRQFEVEAKVKEEENKAQCDWLNQQIEKLTDKGNKLER